jgi:hypothetical protein
MRSRLLVALLDAVTVLFFSGIVARFAGLNLPPAIAIVALAYYTGATMVLGESPAHWLRARRRAIGESVTQGSTASASAWRRMSGRLSALFGHGAEADRKSADEPEMSTWITDAHRVGPALSSRLRVRIKMFQ